MNFSLYRNIEHDRWSEHNDDRFSLAPPSASKPAQPASGLGDLRFARLLGSAQWSALPAAIRQRFSKRLRAGESVVYRGQTITTQMSWFGRLLAQAFRAIGAPLPLERNATGTAAVVTVTEAPEGHGQFWTRQYNRRRGFPQVIHSKKSFSGPTGLEERVGGGIGMTLKLETDRESLLFCSDAYFMTLFGRRVYLPKWATPGDLVIGHHDRGEGSFDFTLDLTHPLLGTLMHQRARFFDLEIE